MPLSSDGSLLNRDNAVSILLHAFRSNTTAKALLVLPEVADDFYLINRDAPKLNLRAPNLLDAITALTNATALRVTWREPFVLLHLPSDRLEPGLQIEDADTAQRLRRDTALSHGVFVDMHWEKLQPRLAPTLQCAVRPVAASQDAWHFGRHNFAGWNLTGWELLAVTALTGDTTATVQKSGIRFQVRARQ